jgi:hypothetical protein
MDDLSPNGQVVPLRVIALRCLAIAGSVAAVIHFAVTSSHFQQYWAYGVFMLGAGLAQACWSVLAASRRGDRRAVLWTGLVLNLAIILVYVVTRTAGDVIGPGAGTAEAFGLGDGLCTALEAVVAVGCGALLVASADRPVPAARMIRAVAATGVAGAVVLGVALLDGGPEMGFGSAAAMAMPGGSSMSGASMSGASISLPTSDPAGNISMPDTSMIMPGMAMASSAGCTATPSAAQQRAAVTLVDNSWSGAQKYQSLAAARAAGYVPITPTGHAVVHYLNRRYYLDTVMGGPVLNTSDPQSLVYANTPHGAVLVAAMYITGPGGPTPQPGGCLTQWHVHTNLCLTRGLGVVATTGDGPCPSGSANRVTPPMIHVWFVPIPGGPTAIDAPDQQVVQAAERVSAPSNGTA